MVAHNQKEKAVTLIFESIISFANAGQFDKADALRQKLIEVDSMALNKIIESAEIIEAEKAKAIDSTHKKIWAAFYDALTAEEANAFYFSLKKARVKPGKMIIQQGKLNHRLFFIDQGTLKVIYNKGGREKFIAGKSHGEIAGLRTFFSISVATTSTISSEFCEIHYLERDTYGTLINTIAGFERKLEPFCQKMVKNDITHIIKKKKIERREEGRNNASGKFAVYLLDANKQPAKVPLYGMLENLSKGGLSLSIKCPNKATARAYLGKFAALKAMSKTSGFKLSQNGIVLSVFDQLFNNYSIGIKFLKPIPLSTVKEFIEP